MRIAALARGGLSVYGGHYDPHADEAIFQARDGETVALTIEYPSAPTSVTKTGSGITSTTPAVSGSKATATLSAIQDGGHLDITATVGGEARIVRIRAGNQSQADGYDSTELV